MIDRMLRSATLAGALCLVLAASASAARRGDGPYTPFPEGDPGRRAIEFLNKLNSARGVGSSTETQALISRERLTRGTKLPGTGTTPDSEKAVPMAANTPSARAGLSGGGGGSPPAVLPFGLAALVLAGAAIGFERRARRRPAHV
jgi:hypothetical protein